MHLYVTAYKLYPATAGTLTNAFICFSTDNSPQAIPSHGWYFGAFFCTMKNKKFR